MSCKAVHIHQSSSYSLVSHEDSVWKGIDTVIVCAGVSALRPLLEVAGITSTGQPATPEGIQFTVDVSNAALRGNYTGPLVSAVTFVRPHLHFLSHALINRA